LLDSSRRSGGFVGRINFNVKSMRVRERDDFYGISISNSYEKCKERDTYTKNWANE